MAGIWLSLTFCLVIAVGVTERFRSRFILALAATLCLDLATNHSIWHFLYGSGA